MDASYVDLADVTHLEFDYMRWLRIVLRVANAKRVLHIGGGACALARALAAEHPTGLQEVCEFDPDVLALAREHLGLRRAPGLRVRYAEGRGHLADQPDDSWDAIVIDAFIGARVPERLISVDALSDAARVAPLTLVNIVDNRSGRDVNAATAAMTRRLSDRVDARPPPREHDHRRLCHRHSPRPEARRVRVAPPIRQPPAADPPREQQLIACGAISAVIQRARVPV